MLLDFKSLITMIVLVIFSLVGGYYVGMAVGVKNGIAQAQLVAEQKAAEAALTSQKAAAQASNPFSGSVTNPFAKVKTNPFAQ